MILQQSSASRAGVPRIQLSLSKGLSAQQSLAMQRVDGRSRWFAARFPGETFAVLSLRVGAAIERAPLVKRRRG